MFGILHSDFALTSANRYYAKITTNIFGWK